MCELSFPNAKQLWSTIKSSKGLQGGRQRKDKGSKKKPIIKQQEAELLELLVKLSDFPDTDIDGKSNLKLFVDEALSVLKIDHINNYDPKSRTASDWVGIWLLFMQKINARLRESDHMLQEAKWEFFDIFSTTDPDDIGVAVANWLKERFAEMVSREYETAGADEDEVSQAFNAAKRQFFDMFREEVIVHCVSIMPNRELVIEASLEGLFRCISRLADFKYTDEYSLHLWVRLTTQEAARDLLFASITSQDMTTLEIESLICSFSGKFDHIARMHIVDSADVEKIAATYGFSEEEAESHLSELRIMLRKYFSRLLVGVETDDPDAALRKILHEKCCEPYGSYENLVADREQLWQMVCARMAARGSDDTDDDI